MTTGTMPVKIGGKSPTCKVCGDESSGFHYGVDSCEGCKVSYRMQNIFFLYAKHSGRQFA